MTGASARVTRAKRFFDARKFDETDDDNDSERLPTGSPVRLSSWPPVLGLCRYSRGNSRELCESRENEPEMGSATAHVLALVRGKSG